MGQVNTHMLTVLTGLNSGARVKLPSGRVSIGGADSDDILLDGFSGTALDVTLGKDAVRIASHLDGVSIENGPIHAAGESARAALPCVVQLDDATSLHICRLAETPKRRSLATALLFFLCLVGALVIAGAQIEFRTPVPANARTQAPESPAAPALPPVQKAEVRAPACTDCQSEAAAYLEAELASAGLYGLSVEHADGALRLTGSHAPAEARLWRDIRRSYDRTWSRRVPLIPAITETISDPPIHIASVWLAEPREIVADDGLSYRIGETVTDGWVVEAIEPGHVLLARGETLARIDF